MSDPLFTPRQAAEFLGYSKPILDHWRIEGRGPAFYKMPSRGKNGRVMYRRSDLEAFLNECRIDPTEA